MRRGMMILCGMLLTLGTFSCDDEKKEENPPVEDTAQPEDNVQQDTVIPEDQIDQDIPGEDIPEQDIAGVDTVLTGACLSESDQATLAAERDAITAKARECGLGCLNAVDKVACAVPCITAAHNISDGCAGCYAGIIVCTVDRCLTDCIADAASEACIKCQEDQGCTPEFYTCSGLIEE